MRLIGLCLFSQLVALSNPEPFETKVLATLRDTPLQETGAEKTLAADVKPLPDAMSSEGAPDAIQLLFKEVSQELSSFAGSDENAVLMEMSAVQSFNERLLTVSKVKDDEQEEASSSEAFVVDLSQENTPKQQAVKRVAVPAKQSPKRPAAKSVQQRSMAPRMNRLTKPIASCEGDYGVDVKRFKVIGAALLPVKQLETLANGYSGKRWSVQALKDIAFQITETYRRAGLSAYAFVPEQSFDDGVVSIAVVEQD